MNGLGQLETAVMDALWQLARPVRVREVVEHLASQRKLAYTTVMTVLDNLHRKAWVTRRMHNRAYLYQPALTREEAVSNALRDVLDSAQNPEAVLLHFARSFTDSERAALLGAIDNPAP